jgi:DNA-binding SARP family transcriptional activator/tetratricopeptide (TPR) repeat protein
MGRESVVGFRLLGPVEAWAASSRVDVGPPRQRAVVAALAADAGRLVPVDTLVNRLWGDDPPARARRTLHTYIARTRRLTERMAAAGEGPVRLVRQAGGYLLDIDADRVDVHRFRGLVARAGETVCGDERRLGLLAEAIGLWRGEPLAGVLGDWAERTRHTWLRQRVDAVVALAHARIRTGNPAAVLEPVGELLGEHPLAEPLAAVLMRALAATGRAPDALDCYLSLRRRLAEELGTDPGPELRAVHQAILRGELDRVPVTDESAAVVSPRVVPAQLPSDVSAFTGRHAELTELDSLLATIPAGVTTVVVISAVSGTAGVGKTALAVHWAHRVRDRFPDGQLYVNLRGYDPERPMAAADALAGFLDELGVAGYRVPPGLDERAARYRSRIAGRRMLVVLDNAATAEQVRPLLPGTPTCAVLVTSRDALAGLVARDGARRLDLDTLPAGDAVALLRLLIGDRAGAEPGAVADLAEQCARLPLALRLVAELAGTRPTTSLAELAAELRDRRLDLLDAGGDRRAAVTAVFSWSVQHLPADTARMFALLGPHPGPDADVFAAAAAAGTGLDHARRMLAQLARAHLVHPTGAGRYGMHDLLRAYASQLAGEDARAGLGRLFDYYLATAAAAMDLLHPSEAGRRPRIEPATTPVPVFANPEAARSWLDAERATLTAVAGHAAEGWPAHAVRLSTILYRYLDAGHHTDALAVHGHARDAARRTGDRDGEARALLGLGATQWQLGRYGPAADHLERALALFRDSGDRTGTARALGNLGVVEVRRGRYGPAAEHHRQALALYRQAGDRSGEAIALSNLGADEGWLGRYDAAIEHHHQALALLRELGDGDSEAVALTTLGDVETRQGRHEQAAEHHRQALALSRQRGDRSGVAWALDSIGTVHTRLGRPDIAADNHRQALDAFRQLADRDGEPWALNGLGEAAYARGLPADAVTHHDAALHIAMETGSQHQEARAHAGLAQAYRALGQPDRAGDHGGHARAIYLELGMPEADQPLM